MYQKDKLHPTVKKKNHVNLVNTILYPRENLKVSSRLAFISISRAQLRRKYQFSNSSWKSSISDDIPPSLSFSPRDFFVSSARCGERSHPSLAKPLLARRRFRVRSAKYPFVWRARERDYFTLRVSLFLALAVAFINFAAASPKNNIVERERNTDSRVLSIEDR